MENNRRVDEPRGNFLGKTIAGVMFIWSRQWCEILQRKLLRQSDIVKQIITTKGTAKGKAGARWGLCKPMFQSLGFLYKKIIVMRELNQHSIKG